VSAREIEGRLIDAMSEMDVVDAHEHIMVEPERLARDVDVLTLFQHYTRTDLRSAGMPEEWAWGKLHDETLPLEARWKVFSRFYEDIKHGSYARAARIAARDIYGVDDINDSTYLELTEKMKAANVPGLYDRILKEKCRIRKILVLGGQKEGDEFFAPLLPAEWLGTWAGRERMEELSAMWGVPVRTWDDLMTMIETALAEWRRRGGSGVKFAANMLGESYPEDARAIFTDIMDKGDVDPGSRVIFRNQLTHEIAERAGAAGHVVAVHTGIIWDNWNDFHQMHPRKLIPYLQLHRSTSFDAYHAGIPWVGTVGVMGKTFPNLHLNLCWCHVISQSMSVRALDEWLDIVPTNKIIGFGGDYSLPVEKVWGHLVMAREDIARALARRVADGLLTEDEAAGLARRFLYENPKRIYGLDC